MNCWPTGLPGLDCAGLDCGASHPSSQYGGALHNGVVVDCGSGHTSVMFYSTGGEPSH